MFYQSDIDYSAGLVETFTTQAAQRGLTIVTQQAFTEGTKTDFSTQINAIRDSGCDLVLLESNYDEAMLQCGPYPYPLKRRIASDSGHLSNSSSALEARTLVDSGTTRLVLGHLSKENNHPELARETVRSELTMAGMAEGGDYLLSVAPRTEPGPMMIF